MAGPGMAPKEPSRRARNNKDPMGPIKLGFRACTPPDLPEDFDWHPMTRRWWSAWQRSPMAALMGEVDWLNHMDTALMHHQMWTKGQWTLAAEVRLRSAQYGATPLDRLRLRIQWVDDRGEDMTQTTSVPERRRDYGQLKVLPPPKENGPEAD